jgi:hypothetical protein
MGWVKKLLGGFILVLILLSLGVSFSAYLLATHGSCSPASTDAGTSSQLLNSTGSSSYSNASLPQAVPYSPVPVAADLILTPLDNLSLTQRNSSALADLTDPAYWEEVHSSELQTYEEILPQTVIGFINSSEEWKAWALQYLPDSPSWVNTGFVAQAQSQVSALDPSSSGNDDNVTAVEQGVNNFAASAAGVTLASLDFISFDGLTAMKTLFETNNPTLAACQTLPGQLAQLYESSFDPGVPQAQRADYLGRALAITSVMLLVGGKDGFADHFQTAMGTLGLGDAWPVVKGYLGDVGSRVSQGASSSMLGILQTLAGRFPQDSVWATGLTADQVDTMVNVLQSKGVPDDVIQNDIQKVAQAAGSSPAEDGAADAADDLEYQQDGGWLQMAVNTENALTIYTDGTGRTQWITVTWLKDNVPGFDSTKPQFIQISYSDQDVAVYNYFSGPKNAGDIVAGGRQWKVTAPSDVAQPGTIVKVKLQILTSEAFVGRLPLLQFNDLGLDASWVTPASEFTGYSISGSDLTIGVTQSEVGAIPVGEYEIDGTQAALVWNGKVVALDFQVVDVFGEDTDMRLVYNGYSNPQLRIATGQTDFAQVLLVSNDGVRLKFVYDTGPDESSTTTVYVKPPSILWSLSAEVPGDPQYLASGGSAVYQIDSVTPTRSLETDMIEQGATYDLGTLGAEIAYTTGTERLGLQNLILHEPSEGGADLNTPDKTTFIQARLVDLSNLSPDGVVPAIQDELAEMIPQLQRDFANNKQTATMGYAIISYIDNQHSIRTIIVQVPYST